MSLLQAGGREEWSDQETLLLLEGVEAHGEGWPAVAAHVGTKSQLQCAMRFLQVSDAPLATCSSALYYAGALLA